MKKILLSIFLFSFLGVGSFAQNTHTIGAVPADYGGTTLPTGSYVIAMDNNLQAGSFTFVADVSGLKFNYVNGSAVLTAVTNTTGITVGMVVTGQAAIPAGATVTAVTGTTVTISSPATATASNKALTFGHNVGVFNLYAYGLVVYLLNNDVHVKWVIQAQKAKDGIDFSVDATRIKPTLGSAGSKDFKAGPFVILPADTTGVAAKVQAYNDLTTTHSDVNIYKTNADVHVDVRFDYKINNVIWKPKAAVLDDGGNGDIHAGYYVMCGIVFGANGTVTLSGGTNGKLSGTATSATNWTLETTPHVTTNCYTFASEPHNAKDTTLVVQASPLITTGTIIRDIRKFVQDGGNFLAQCHAIWTYENYYGSGAVTGGNGGRFFTKEGIWRGTNAGTNATISPEAYIHPDLSYGQFEGVVDVNKGGSLTNFKLNTTAGNVWRNSEEHHVSGVAAQADIAMAGVAKLPGTPDLGGMIFYLGNHTFGDDETDNTVVNGLRMYMNAFLTPNNPQGSLLTPFLPHPSSFGSETTVDVSSTGPDNAYPLTFKLYHDNAPAGYGPEDVQAGNTVTIVASGGSGTINSGDHSGSFNYVLLISPNSGCLQPIQQFFEASTLPIVLFTFTATRSHGNVDLAWKTALEANNKGFEIQRQIGATGNWESIGFVNSKAPNGNSSTPTSYEYVDVNANKGVTLYRLRQVDIDNRSSYSVIRSVPGEDQAGRTIVYPNPSSNGNVNVVFESANVVRDVSLTDMIGRTVKQWKGVTNNNIQIENLSTGSYTLLIVNKETGKQDVQKIVVNKR